MSSSALDDKGALQYRLALGAATATATSKGGRGTLTRSAQNLLLLGELPLLVGGGGSNKKTEDAPSSSAAGSRRDAARELRLLQVEMNKMRLVLKRIQRETQQVGNCEEPEGEEGGGRDFRALSHRVHELRHLVGTAQQAQACQVEYEALATLLHRRHATPQHVLQAQVDAIDRQVDAATTELHQKQNALKVRTAQVSALVQSILDLKQSLLVSVEEGGHDGSEEAAPTPTSSSAPLPTSDAAKTASESSADGPARKRRRRDSGDAELASASKRPGTSTPNHDDGIEEGEESNPRMDQAGGRKGGNGDDDDEEEEEEELYGDL